MKIFEYIKNRKPLGDKGKGRLQGVAIGLGLAAVGFVVSAVAYGCSSSVDSGESVSGSFEKERVDAFQSSSISDLTGYTWVGYENLSSTLNPHNYFLDFALTSDGTTYNTFGFAYAGGDFVGGFSDGVFHASPKRAFLSHIYYWHGSVYDYVWNGSWTSDAFRSISITGGSDSTNSDLISWFVENGTLTSNGSQSSSSEETSSSEEASASEESQTSSVAQSVDSLDVKSRRFTFAETNPFSAWAVNPLSDDRATGYDLGAPWLLYTGSPSGSGATTETTAKYSTFSVGRFYVEGNASAEFDAIAVTTLNLSTDNAFVFDGETDAQLVSADMFARGAFIISNVYYVNTSTDHRVKVMDFGSTSATLNGNAVTALTAPRWLNVGFKNVVYVGNDGDVTINGYTAPATWWLENNGLSQTAGVSTMVLGNSSTGVFGLLASSFGAIGAILGISLIPGLTLGTLMFIPLVVMVIFAIIKILNK